MEASRVLSIMVGAGLVYNATVQVDLTTVWVNHGIEWSVMGHE